MGEIPVLISNRTRTTEMRVHKDLVAASFIFLYPGKEMPESSTALLHSYHEGRYLSSFQEAMYNVVIRSISKHETGV